MHNLGLIKDYFVPVKGKPKNRLATKLLKVSANGKVVRYLTQLVDSGLYGQNATEAAQQVLLEALRRLKKEGEIKLK